MIDKLKFQSFKPFNLAPQYRRFEVFQTKNYVACLLKICLFKRTEYFHFISNFEKNDI